MKVLSTEGLTKLIELVKSAFISVDDTVSTNFVTLAKVATSGSYNDLTNKPTIPTDTSDLTNGARFITGINSTDVTTALGYTPYNSTNPSGYQANVLETVKVNGTAQTITGKAVNIPVPTKVSQLTNDSGYTTNTGTVTSVNNTQPDANGNVSLTMPTVGNGTITITQGGTTKGSFTTNQSGNATIDLDSGSQGASRNIGEIVQSTIPLSDAGLHLLDGSLLQYGSYKAFIDYIASIYNSNLSYFCTESDWQTSVTNYGVCGKFVYNSTNNTVRLPRIIGFTEGVIDPTTLGDLTEAGLPNITGHIYYKTSSDAYDRLSGAFVFDYRYAGVTPAGSNKDENVSANFDAHASNPIYGNSTTVQPQSIKVLYYIVVANSTKTEIEVDIDEIATDLNGKADSDLSNVPTSKGILTDSYISGSSWYRVYADGWCEQGGIATGGNNGTGVLVSLLKNYTNTNYTLVTGGTSRQSEVFPNNGVLAVKIRNISVSGFYATTNWVTESNAGYTNYEFSWCAYGYIR